jgi:hypothetical protein
MDVLVSLPGYTSYVPAVADHADRIVAMVVGFCGTLLFLFVPETFWDRAPVPRSRKPSGRPSFLRRLSSRPAVPRQSITAPTHQMATAAVDVDEVVASPHSQRGKGFHVGFAPETEQTASGDADKTRPTIEAGTPPAMPQLDPPAVTVTESDQMEEVQGSPTDTQTASTSEKVRTLPTDNLSPPAVSVHDADNSPISGAVQGSLGGASVDYFTGVTPAKDAESDSNSVSLHAIGPRGPAYTHVLRERPAKSFAQHLKPFHGRLNRDKWFKVMVRPFILFSYPSVLWSAAVYACSVGWLIVISESVAIIYRDHDNYNFNALQTGLVYISPFIGGILGTAVAGKVSDIIVKAMAARNGGLYEPEFRLVMAAPVAVTTVIGLMGFGWSAEVKDNWIVPTVFFGVVSFGCSLGSTTSITFCVDSYRQYAGEALVTLNFSKNIFHGLVFSLFVTNWLTQDGPKAVYIWIGVIQLVLLLFTIPMFILGKRARMWTVRKNFMEKF